MALENGNGNGLVMPVAPMYGGGMGGGFGNGFGGDGWWILLLFILLGGWNNGFGGGGFGGNIGGDLYPWMNQSNQINGGFRDQMINDNVTSIRDGVFGISNQLCNGFAGVTASITGAQNAIAQQLYTNQIADMQQTFGVQTALQNCCCENRAGLADVKYTIATEECATRNNSTQNTRDIIDSQTRGTQLILDKLCALELDGYKRENDNLRSQLNMSQLAASQTAQTALIRDGQLAATTALVNELRSCPIPSQPVYGSQPIFTCPNNNNNCGCGCGGNF